MPAPLLLAAGQRAVPDGVACLCSGMLGFFMEHISEAFSARERMRCVRHTYSMLQWIAQRVAELVRAREERPRHPRRHAAPAWLSAPWPAASLRTALVPRRSSQQC